jgi:hypothetical protein
MNDHPTGENHCTEISAAFEQAHAAVADGLRLVLARQTDPLTIRNTIKDISEHLDFIEIEVNRLVGSVERWERIAGTLQLQRDEALRQRDYLIHVFEQLYNEDNPDNITF